MTEGTEDEAGEGYPGDPAKASLVSWHLMQGGSLLLAFKEKQPSKRAGLGLQRGEGRAW